MEDKHKHPTNAESQQRKTTPEEDKALSKLCDACQAFLRTMENPRVDLPHHASTIQSPRALKLALEDGCHICTVVLDKISDSEKLDAIRKLWYTESPHTEYTESIYVRVDKTLNAINQTCAFTLTLFIPNVSRRSSVLTKII